MTQFRSRDEQIIELSAGCDDPNTACAHTLEAEARGAAEARRVDAEGHRVFYVRSDTLRFSSFPFMDAVLWKTPVPEGGDFTALHTHPAHVAALDERIAELEEAATDAIALIREGRPVLARTALCRVTIDRAALKREGGV